MEEDDDDLKLVKASAGLLADLEHDLPKVLWKRDRPGQPRQAHSQVKKRDLDRIVSLIEPFQGEPQLLDAKLQVLLPPIVDAYLQHLIALRQPRAVNVDIQTAVCVLLYTLAKVRGYKVVTGFLNNEPRYLEPILEALERTISNDTPQVQWQVPYVLLLWLWHLLLTPFDLISISTKSVPQFSASNMFSHLPHLTHRILLVGLHYLDSPTKAQDAAAMMIMRLTKRPDVQAVGLADLLVEQRLPKLREAASEMQDTYEMLGSLRLIAGVSSSAELGHLIPAVYQTCLMSFDQQDNAVVVSNAVAKKIVVKIFRNIAILSLRSMSTSGPLLDFLQESGVLENVIDYLLRSLADKDTPVRFAAAKAISLVVLELEPEMGHEIIQAVLDSFKEDIPRSAKTLDFSTANPLKWHGLTLTLAHTLFTRSASTEQLPDILNALISALQFQQRTTTGSTLGTNVRDAANFGIWSLARRYTTAELLPVKVDALHSSNRTGSHASIIQVLAIQLILSACLDPAGNIRRGSSASLQELVGRHPDQIHDGIALVQIVDYQAVSLRRRAMIDVATQAAGLHVTYWHAVFEALFVWRGIGSVDVPSRENAAESIANLAVILPSAENVDVLQALHSRVQACQTQEIEQLHGLTLAAASVLTRESEKRPQHDHDLADSWSSFAVLQPVLKEFSPRLLRSEFPAAFARYTTALCKAAVKDESSSNHVPMESIDLVVDSLLYRREEWILAVVPALTLSVLQLKRVTDFSLACIGAQTLAQRVATDGSKSTVHSAGRAIALGTLAGHYDQSGLSGEKATIAVSTLANLMSAMNVDWRIIGAKALLLVAQDLDGNTVDPQIAQELCMALHQGMNDYTIDERGDVGSLVRLQGIDCASQVLHTLSTERFPRLVQTLSADIYRLSLEKLDRVRVAAANVRGRELEFGAVVGTGSSIEYFAVCLAPLTFRCDPYIHRAIIEGAISCAGVGSESLLQASRRALVTTLDAIDLPRLEALMIIFAAIMKDLQADIQNNNIVPALELLAFLLDMQIPQRLTNFKWRNLLSTVQKSHHKSNDIPKILAAAHVYIGLADVDAIREEVLKKLIGMLKTNPYPRIRSAVAEALWVITKDEGLREVNGSRPAAQNKEIVDTLSQRYIHV